ncbi:MAG: hypothetical protein KAS98_15850 [Deltaproteobacteria bacterium]|jgi:uncharacterized protein YqgQ|nr:hypothetical protein [Deltaproteobacteria bacterium]MBW2651673.1 hypothetical protein [Deltaproteobacteria bacterium]MCK5011969.1 hypothetical protein [Deltaproteobacteria bacterium]MCK5187742.1 hypothetical protein [Deltaproteobacteria bacterium]MCK5422865.1 hypothetical protein [Deltaproteobacteria bacterium]
MARVIDLQKEMEMIQIEELAYSNMIQHEALIRMLVSKGIITKKEYFREVGIVTKEMKSKKEKED